jgi:ribonuclease P protein component
VTSDDFRHTLRRGKKTPIQGGVVAVVRTDNAHPLRCGFVVSKAIGNAAERNSVKRRLRAACRTLVASFSGADIVVRADQHAPSVTVEVWTRGIQAALDKAARS